MARFNKILHLAILTAGTFLSGVVIRPAAARQAQDSTVRVWDEGAADYTYTGCFTSDPSTPALDEGTSITAAGRMTPKACLRVCQFSSVAFLDVDRRARAKHMKHMKHLKDLQHLDNRDDEDCDDDDNKNAKNENKDIAVLAQDHHQGNSNSKNESDYDYHYHNTEVYDHDNDKKFQYAGLAYSEELGASVCTCSDGLATVSENVPDAECDAPCDGDSAWSCGGPDLIVLYNLTQGGDGSHDGGHGPHKGAAVANGVSAGVLIGAFLVAVGSF